MTNAAPPDPAGTGWHLDRRVPIALLVTIVFQTVGIVWWASAINSRVAVLEQNITSASDQPERMTKVETFVDILRETTARIERKIDRLIEQQQSSK